VLSGDDTGAPVEDAPLPEGAYTALTLNQMSVP